MSRGLALVSKLVRRDDGMAVAEYAVGCAAACGFGYCLWKVLTSDRVYELLERMIREGWLNMAVFAGPWS